MKKSAVKQKTEPRKPGQKRKTVDDLVSQAYLYSKVASEHSARTFNRVDEASREQLKAIESFTEYCASVIKSEASRTQRLAFVYTADMESLRKSLDDIHNRAFNVQYGLLMQMRDELNPGNSHNQSIQFIVNELIVQRRILDGLAKKQRPLATRVLHGIKHLRARIAELIP